MKPLKRPPILKGFGNQHQTKYFISLIPVGLWVEPLSGFLRLNDLLVATIV